MVSKRMPQYGILKFLRLLANPFAAHRVPKVNPLL